MSAFELFAVSALTGGLAEFGDKTQLLLALLSARLRRPGVILAGLLVATLTHRVAAAAIASWSTGVVSGQILQTVVGVGFIAIAIWVLAASEESLVPVDAGEWVERLGPFMASAAAFFLAEIGDKTQVATFALTARFGSPMVVSLGTTAGILVAALPVLLLGNLVGHRLQMRAASLALAIVLAVLGVMTLMGFHGWH